MFTPKDTLRFLDILEENGFNDSHFRIVHPKPGETINNHRGYVKGLKTNRFVKKRKNFIICQRLEFLVKHKNVIEDPSEFNVLARVAENEFPFVKN